MIEIKGSVIRDSIESIKKRNGEDVYDNIVGRLNDETKKVFENIVLSSSWYRLDDFVRFLEQDLLQTANGHENELIKRSETLIEKQLKGLYKFFIKLGSPEFVLNRSSMVFETYFRGISVNVKMGNNRATLTFTGFEKQHRLMGFSIIGFYTKALEMSGAKDVNMRYVTLIESNKGYCEFELTWTGK
ncbi:MAG TPA: hypothetical protein VLX91_08365 [Candidatus Acidoferrales bacterium]|nr:hypothetical protein [Candidatus Acidoferrales bacterium]